MFTPMAYRVNKLAPKGLACWVIARKIQAVGTVARGCVWFFGTCQ